jgi:NAD(P)-dependent dehydrogenase (short-subunit alcohol dehydrogenase family)
MVRLEGKVAIVTGAGRSVGRGIALRFASEGARVIVASRSPETVDKVSAEIQANGGAALGVTVDVSNREAVDAMVAEAIQRFGQVDILVNNAQSWGKPGRKDADPPPHALEDYPEDEWDYTYQTGLKGTLYGMWAVFPGMRDRGWGRIINFYSPAAQQALPNLAAYNCTKEAIRSLTRSAAREWGKHGITVNCISPVIINDSGRRQLARITDPDQLESAKRASLERIPLGRFGDAEQDAGAVLTFLASDDAGFVTGETLRVDGGFAI